MNQVVLVGRLTRDPELKYIPGTGTAVASFTIAVDRNYIKKEYLQKSVQNQYNH